MSENQRQFQRQNIQVEIEFSFLEDAPRKVITRDVSQGGLFMLLDNPSHYTMGEMISLDFKNPLEENADTHKDAIIVRHSDDGIAIAYIEIEDF